MDTTNRAMTNGIEHELIDDPSFSSLEDDLVVDDASNGEMRAELHPAWQRWGVNGGYLAATSLTAAARRSTYEFPGSMTTHFLARARPGDASIEVHTLQNTRRGESLLVSLSQDGDPVATSMVWMTPQREDDAGDVVHDVGAPEFAPIADVPSVRELIGERTDGWHRKYDHHDLSAAQDWRNREATEPVVQAYTRFRPASVFSTVVANCARYVVITDIYPYWALLAAHPGAELRYRGPTLELSVVFSRPSSTAGVLLVDSRVPASIDGRFVGTTTVRAENGTLLATGLQHSVLVPRSPGPTPK